MFIPLKLKLKGVRVVEEEHCLISLDTRCIVWRECLELFPVSSPVAPLPDTQRGTSLSRASLLAASLCLAVIVVVVVNCVTVQHRAIFLQVLFLCFHFLVLFR